MIFATGEIKEGLFVEGVFKMEGTELEVKNYMKKNNMKTSELQISSSSPNKTKNVKFPSNINTSTTHSGAGDPYSHSTTAHNSFLNQFSSN